MPPCHYILRSAIKKVPYIFVEKLVLMSEILRFLVKNLLETNLKKALMNKLKKITRLNLKFQAVVYIVKFAVQD